EAESSGHNKDSYPATSKIRFEFPKLEGRAPFTLFWSDKSQLPPEELYAEFLKKPDKDGKPRTLALSGALIVGDKCTMYADGEYGHERIERSGGFEWMDVEYPKPIQVTTEAELPHVEEFYRGI